MQQYYFFADCSIVRTLTHIHIVYLYIYNLNKLSKEKQIMLQSFFALAPLDMYIVQTYKVREGTFDASGS